MPVRASRTPSLRLHKPSGQAVVTVDGRDFYLGRFGSAESQVEYDRLLAEWLANGRRLAVPSVASSDITVNEMMEAYLAYADACYTKNGKPTKEPADIRYAIRPVRKLYGDTLARNFGPLALKTVRRALIESGLCLNEVNKRVGKIKRAFKWAVSEEIAPTSVYHGLQTVAGLRRGRAGVRESTPVRPAPDALVNAIRPHVARQVWAMIELQRLTGMRPGEVCTMRTIDVDTSGRVWQYTPESHKTEHHGKRRVIYLGPQAQSVLGGWLGTDLTAPLFQPREAVEEQRRDKRLKRKTPVQPSQRDRAKRRPDKRPGLCYTVKSYCHAIAYGCARAFPHPREAEFVAKRAGMSAAERRKLTQELKAWRKANRADLAVWRREHRFHANQLRHSAATRLRREFGLDVTRAILGHSSPVVTEIYAEMDMAKAAEAMQQIG